MRIGNPTHTHTVTLTHRTMWICTHTKEYGCDHYWLRLQINHKHNCKYEQGWIVWIYWKQSLLSEESARILRHSDRSAFCRAKSIFIDSRLAEYGENPLGNEVGVFIWTGSTGIMSFTNHWSNTIHIRSVSHSLQLPLCRFAAGVFRNEHPQITNNN